MPPVQRRRDDSLPLERGWPGVGGGAFPECDRTSSSVRSAMARTHAYRVEISGGFSGSAYRFESLLTGSLREVERFIATMNEDEQSAAMMVTEGFEGIIDVIVDGELIARTSFLPALRFVADGRRFHFVEGAWAMDDEILDEDALADELDEILDAFSAGFTCEVALAAIELPEVDGEPLADGISLEVTNAAGRTYEHVCGQIVGDFGEAHR